MLTCNMSLLQLKGYTNVLHCEKSLGVPKLDYSGVQLSAFPEGPMTLRNYALYQKIKLLLQ